MLRAVVVSAALAVGSGTAFGQAFGLAMGTQIDDLVTTRPSTVVGTYDVEPPVPNAMFDRYSVIASPNEGVCAVTASVDGAERVVDWVRINLDLVPLLQEKYGEPAFQLEPPKYTFAVGGQSGLDTVELAYSPPHVLLSYYYSNLLDCTAELGRIVQDRLKQGL